MVFHSNEYTGACSVASSPRPARLVTYRALIFFNYYNNFFCFSPTYLRFKYWICHLFLCLHASFPCLRAIGLPSLRFSNFGSISKYCMKNLTKKNHIGYHSSFEIVKAIPPIFTFIWAEISLLVSYSSSIETSDDIINQTKEKNGWGPLQP